MSSKPVSNPNIPYSIAQNANEFLMGMASNIQSDNKEDLAAKIYAAEIIEDLEKDLRIVYDRLIPNINVVSVTTYTNILIDNIIKYPEKFGTADSPVFKNLLDADSSDINYIRNSVRKHISSYHKNLLISQGEATDPIKKLGELSQELFKRTRNIDNPISARYLGYEFSRRINQIFNSKSILASVNIGIVDTSDNKEDVYVFFSRSFTSIVDAFKRQVGSKIEADLVALFDKAAAKSISVASVVNLGHAAFKTGVSYYINSPAFAKALFGVGSGRSSRFKPTQLQAAASAFKLESKIIDNYIEVDKNFNSTTSGIDILLSLGVTITLPEDWAENQARGRTTEKAALKSFGITPLIPRTRQDRINYTRALASRVYRSLGININKGRSSRNIEEFLGYTVASLLKGITPKKESSKKKIKVPSKIKVLTKTGTKPTSFASPKGIKHTSAPALRTAQGTFTSLASLQSMLNLALHDQIRKNMGTGTSKNILNYRSGRLAESAEVTSMSQSREGMITAFYTYMRNPYATFSQGGVQGSPPSRDPKLLISKSIREVLATQVNNRLRAVLV